MLVRRIQDRGRCATRLCRRTRQAQGPPQFLRHGDVVRIEIDGIGTLENKFV